MSKFSAILSMHLRNFSKVLATVNRALLPTNASSHVPIVPRRMDLEPIILSIHIDSRWKAIMEFAKSLVDSAEHEGKTIRSGHILRRRAMRI